MHVFWGVHSQGIGDFGDEPGGVHPGVAGAELVGQTGMSLPAAGYQTQPGDATANHVQPVVVLVDTARLAYDDAVGM